MNLNLTTATRYGLNVLAALGASLALYFGKSIFVPLTIAGLLAALLWPWANWIHTKLKLPWFFACSSAIGLLGLVVALIATLIAVSVPHILSDLPNPNNPVSVKTKYENLRKLFVTSFPEGAIDERILPENVEDAKLYQEFVKYLRGEQITKDILDFSGRGMHILTEVVLILFILLFLLLEAQMLADKVRNIFGSGLQVQLGVSNAFREVAEGLRSYLVWRTIINIGMGLVLGFVYYLCGLKQFLLWAILTMILCYIPYLGTIAAGVLPVLDALVSLGPWWALAILMLYLLVATAEGYVVVPWMMGRSMDLNATTVLISCLFWYLVWGTAGLFLAMPMMAAIKAVCKHTPGWSAWGDLMGSGHTPPPPTDVAPAIAEVKAV